MKLRCAVNLHRWVGERGVWYVSIHDPESNGKGDMGLEPCLGCNALRYTTVAVTYRN